MGRVAGVAEGPLLPEPFTLVLDDLVGRGGGDAEGPLPPEPFTLTLEE